MAVRAVEENGFSPELVIAVLGLSRSCMYHWLKRYREQGLKGLESKVAPGAAAQVTAEIEQWLCQRVLTSTPVEHGCDTLLWTRDILATLVRERFGVTVTGRTISGHLKKLGLSYQKPCYRAVAQDPEEVEQFLEDKFPRIERLAAKRGADIAFEDEAGMVFRPAQGTLGALRDSHPRFGSPTNAVATTCSRRSPPRARCAMLPRPIRSIRAVISRSFASYCEVALGL